MSNKKSESCRFCRLFNPYFVHFKSCKGLQDIPLSNNCVQDLFKVNSRVIVFFGSALVLMSFGRIRFFLFCTCAYVLQ